METSNLVLLSCNIVVAGCALYVAHRANVHFKLRNVFDWGTQVNSEEFLKHFQVVAKLIDCKDPDSLVSRIESDPKNSKISVAYVLNVMEQAATAAHFGFLERDLLVRYVKFHIPYLHEGLQPWIKYRRKTGDQDLFKDFDWLYDYYKSIEIEFFVTITMI